MQKIIGCGRLSGMKFSEALTHLHLDGASGPIREAVYTLISLASGLLIMAYAALR